MATDASTLSAGESVPRRKRRWWVYLAIGFGSLVVLALAAFLAVVAYYHSLINTYTTRESHPLASTEFSPADRQKLIERWQQFHQDVLAGKRTAPFQLSASDLQNLVAANPKMKDRIRISFVEHQIRAEFSVPLDQPHKRELQGRYLNGSALLQVGLAPDGFPLLKVISLEANGTAPPGWLASRVKQKNLLEDLHRNPYLVELLSGIADVAVADNRLVITPANER